MSISKSQAKSFVMLGLRHVCKVKGVTEARLNQIVECTPQPWSAESLVEAIVAHAQSATVIDIGRSLWREKLANFASDSLAAAATCNVHVNGR